MLGLVNDILDFNKIEAGHFDIHPTETNLKKLLQQSTLPFYNRFEEKKLELLLEVDESLNQEIMVDDLRLVQVLYNLLSNSLKFTEHGHVKVRALLKGINVDGATVLFSVEDTGIGIKEVDQEKIFGSFWQVNDKATRKHGGTGLGLTICKRLLELMNSTLHVLSEEGKGTTFHFTLVLPIVSRKVKKVEHLIETDEQLKGIKILLAEDNIINTMIARKYLEDNQATVITAENGQIALECLEQKNDFDLILLDLEMPVMDGYTAIKSMRLLYPDIPVIAFTAALMDQQMLQQLLQMGFKDCILKPFQPLDLFAKVRKYTHPAVAFI